MMRKTFSYIALGFKAVFLLGIKLFEAFSVFSLRPSKVLMRTSVIALILMSSFNFEALAQSCPEGQRRCRGECRTARDCRQGVPPPPGLPIDSKLPYLLIAGLGLGIYFLKAKKPV